MTKMKLVLIIICWETRLQGGINVFYSLNLHVLIKQYIFKGMHTQRKSLIKFKKYVFVEKCE